MLTALSPLFFFFLTRCPYPASHTVSFTICLKKRVRMLQFADEQSVSRRERRAHTYDFFSLSERISPLRGHWSFAAEHSSPPTAGPESTEYQGEHLCTPSLTVASVYWCAPTSRAWIWQVVSTSARDDLDVDAGDQCIGLGTRVVGLAKPR